MLFFIGLHKLSNTCDSIPIDDCRTNIYDQGYIRGFEKALKWSQRKY